MDFHAYTVKPRFTDIRFNEKIRYNDNFSRKNP